MLQTKEATRLVSGRARSQPWMTPKLMVQRGRGGGWGETVTMRIRGNPLTYSPRVRHCYKTMYINSFIPHTKTLIMALLPSSFHRWGNWGRDVVICPRSQGWKVAEAGFEVRFWPFGHNTTQPWYCPRSFYLKKKNIHWLIIPCSIFFLIQHWF